MVGEDEFEPSKRYAAEFRTKDNKPAPMLKYKKAVKKLATNAVSGIDNAILRFSLKYGTQLAGKMGSEALEEGLQSVLEPIFQQAILNNDAEVDLEEVTYSALLGGAMGGMFGGFELGAEIRAEHKKNISTGKAAKAQENFKAELEGVIQEAMKLPETAEAHHLAVAAQKKISAGKELSDAEVGALYRETAMQLTGENKNTAPEEGTVKPMLRMEDFINPNSDVFRNVEYDDKATQNNIMQSTHTQMVADGNVAVIGSDALGTVEQAYPDLRSMKKEERTKILREKVKGLKQSLRSFLSGLKGNYKFEVNGNILEAKLYDTGINEVLDRVTKDKASMLYGSKDIFEKAQYLYSTPDYEGNPNIYRWNYFYTPVQIGDTVTGVRIAVRDMAKTAESQIYHWGIKNEATLGGGGDGNTVSHTDASSAASNNKIAQPVEIVNNEGGNQNGQATGNQPVGTADLSAGQGNIGRAVVSDGERGGTVGAGAYEQAAPMAGGARESRGADGRRAAYERQARIQAIRDSVRDVLPRSPAKLGIPGGEKDATLKIVPVAFQTEEMKQVEAWFAEHGISAYFFVGSLSIQQSGKHFTANGMLHGDRVFIRADSPFFDLEQIAEHEKFHLLKRENPGLVEQLMYELQNEYSPEAFKQIVDKYVKAYGKVIDMSKEDAELRIWNEILADAYAGMNARAVDVAAYHEDVTQRVQKYTGEGRQAQSNGVRQTNGPNSQAIENEAEFALGPEDYYAPITVEDVNVLRSIGRKSVNEFTADDLKKTQKWAHKFYQEMGLKSPFFRAWFGEWRENSKNPIQKVKEKKDSRLTNGRAENRDVGMTISWNAHDVIRETRIHSARERVSVSAIQQLPEIIKNAIFLDSAISDHSSNSKMDNTAFMHSFYTVYETDEGAYVLKLYAEMALNNKGDTIFSRAYQLKDIKKIAALGNGVSEGKPSLSGANTATDITISDLIDIVKRYDSEYNPKPSSEAVNEDGTPKLYYHGTDANWTTYDLDKNKNQMWGDGIYLTDDPERARLYGENVIPVYVQARYNNRDAKRLGVERDHVFMKNTGDILVFSPTQIKSATSNIGTFDGNNPDIEYALGSEPVDTDMDLEERMRHYANVPEYRPGMESNGAEAEDIDVDELLRWDEPVNSRRQNAGFVNVPKSEFEGTPHLRELGVQIENSVGDYWGTAAAVANDKAAKAMKRQ